MNKKKKMIFTVLGIILAGVLAFSGVVYFLLKDKLMLRSRIKELVDSDYSYTIDFSIKGLDTTLPETIFSSQISGMKSDKTVYGQVNNDILNGMEVYMKDDGGDTQVVFNVKPVIDNAFSNLGNVSGISLISRLLPKGDMFVSLSQIEEITGTKLASIRDAGVNMTFFEKLAKGIDTAMKIQVTDAVTSSHRFVGSNAKYFEIYLDDYDTKVIIGVPLDRDDKRISLMVTHDDISWILVGAYETGQTDAISVPEETLDESQVETLKTIYNKIQEIKNFLN